MSRIRVSCALIFRDGQLLAARRSPSMPDPGLWEFPGGKIEAHESPESCLSREIREELGIEIEVGEALPAVERQLPGRVIELLPFVCCLISGEPHAHEHDLIHWAEPGSMLDLDWIPADLDILQHWLEGE